MFGKQKQEPKTVERVPVFNVPSLPQDYEPIKMLHTIYGQGDKLIGIDNDAYEKLIEKLGELGSLIGADAVIGLTFHTAGGSHVQPLHAFGTAIKYKM